MNLDKFFKGVPDWLSACALGVQPTGSSYTCYPPVTNTDIDVLVWLDQYQKSCAEVRNILADEGWAFCGSEIPQEENSSALVIMRKGDVNLIITTDMNFYYKFYNATKLCKNLNLLDKNQRIALFQAILYGNFGDVK